MFRDGFFDSGSIIFNIFEDAFNISDRGIYISASEFNFFRREAMIFGADGACIIDEMLDLEIDIERIHYIYYRDRKK